MEAPGNNIGSDRFDVFIPEGWVLEAAPSKHLDNSGQTQQEKSHKAESCFLATGDQFRDQGQGTDDFGKFMNIEE